MKRYNWRFSVKLISPEALKQFLRFRGMSYAELASRVGCSKSLIGHLASGRNTHTGVDVAKGIAKTLDVPVDALFCRRCLLFDQAPIMGGGRCRHEDPPVRRQIPNAPRRRTSRAG
ncbi:helix-turn-helix transcriptional regulator [Trueperella bialowiezensis]|uniref:helix-turn-helix transcriptional regulator n=1 Tax=Trueperella bialowiezensis TaxID=312285 RepID=UPI000F817B9B